MPRRRTCDDPRQAARKRDLNHCGRSAAMRRTKRSPDCGARPNRSTIARSVGLRSGCNVGDDRSSAGSLSAYGNSSARSQAPASATTRGLSSNCPTPMIGASIGHIAESRWAAVDRCADAPRMDAVPHCRPRGIRRAVAIKHLAKIRGAGQYVVAWIVRVCAESIAGAQRGVGRGHDLHQAHGAFGATRLAHGRHSRGCITARNKCAGTSNRRDASVIKSAKRSVGSYRRRSRRRGRRLGRALCRSPASLMSHRSMR